MTGSAAPHGMTSTLPIPLPVHPPRQMTHEKRVSRP